MSKVHLTVLGFINYKSSHGYEILNTIKTRKMDVWAGIKTPSVYNALQWLENKSYIIGETQIEGNNPPKKVYSLTLAGKKYLKELVISYLREDSVGVDYWLALSFSYRTMTNEQFINLMISRLDHLKEHVSCDKEIINRIERQYQDQELPFIHKHLMKMGASVHEVEIDLINDIIKEAKEEKNQNYFLKDGDI